MSKVTIQIKIEKKETTVQDVELPVPCFFTSKCGTKYVGLVNEKTVIEITTDIFEKSIRSYDNDAWNAGMDRVKNAYNNYHGGSETLFTQKYDEVIRAISQTTLLQAI